MFLWACATVCDGDVISRVKAPYRLQITAVKTSKSREQKKVQQGEANLREERRSYRQATERQAKQGKRARARRERAEQSAEDRKAKRRREIAALAQRWAREAKERERFWQT